MPSIAQPLVRGPFGENRLLPDDMLADNISPDALNADYSKGTIKKRPGYVKVNTEAVKEGGVRVTNAAADACIFIKNISDYDLTGDFTIEVFVIFMGTLETSGVMPILQKLDTGTTSGWQLRYNWGTDQWQFSMYSSAPALVTRSKGSVPMEVGKLFHVSARRTGTNVSLDVNGDSSGNSTVSGSNANNFPFYIGPVDAGTTAPGNETGDLIYDETRIWTDFRTDAELAETRERELNPTEVADTNLAGYWQMNDARWNTVIDSSKNANHGTFFTAGPSFEAGLVPEASEDGYAIRFDGVDDTAVAAYNAKYAPILDTGNTWTFEAWCRIDINQGGDAQILQLGDNASGKNPFKIRFDGTNLEYRYQTLTTHAAGVIADTTFDPVIGEPFHFAIVRDGVDSIFSYINGELVDTETGVTAEVGPTSSTADGMFFGHLDAAGALSQYGAITLDEVRVWITARSQTEIQQWMNRRYPDGTNSNLAGYWRFDAADKELDETGGSDLTLSSDGDKPEWGRGMVYPQTAPRMLLCAPLSSPQRADEVRSGRNLFKREMLLATHTDFWSIEGSTPNHLKRFESPGESGLFDWCSSNDYIVMTNGLEDNMKYNAGEIPRTLSIPQPTAALTATETGAGGAWPLADGDYLYRYAYRNSKDGTESLASEASNAAAMVGATHDTSELTSIGVSTNAQVDKVRIYRRDPNVTTYRFLADIDNGTTTYSDTGTDITLNDAIDDARGHAQPHKYCATYNNALFLFNTPVSPSRLTFSEVGKGKEGNIQASSFVDVDPGDGDEGTGIIAAFGGLVVFKQNSIHFLTGQGVSTYAIRKTIWGQGCVSAATIASSPLGVYFLSHDGVYLMTDVNTVQPVSFDQQNLFLTMDPDLLRFSTGMYDHVQHVYLVSLDTATLGPGAYVDKEPNLFSNYWDMGADGTDTIENDDLTDQGSSTHVLDGNRGACVNLDGSSDYFQSDQNFSNEADGDFSIGLWFKADSVVASYLVTIGDPVLPLGGEDFHFVLSHGFANTRLTATVTPSSGSAFGASQESIDGQDWTHVVATFDVSAQIVRLYINGQFRTSTTGSGTSGIKDLTEPTFSVGEGVSPSVGGERKFDGRIQNVFWVKDVVIESWQIAEIYEYESQAGFLQAERPTMAYDEESQTWAKWDAPFDYLVNAEFTQNRKEILGTRGGFLYRLFDGLTDGSRILEGGTTPLSGSLSTQSSATINESGADFPTSGDGLAGTPLLAVPTDTTQANQLRTIIGNDVDDLYLNQGFSPAITGTYYVGPIQWHWESRWMDLGDIAVVKQLRRLFMSQREDSAANTVTVQHKTNEYETFDETSFTTADEWNEMIVENRGRKIKLRFSNIFPNENVDLSGFQLLFDPAEVL